MIISFPDHENVPLQAPVLFFFSRQCALALPVGQMDNQTNIKNPPSSKIHWKLENRWKQTYHPWWWQTGFNAHRFNFKGKQDFNSRTEKNENRTEKNPTVTVSIIAVVNLCYVLCVVLSFATYTKEGVFLLVNSWTILQSVTELTNRTDLYPHWHQFPINSACMFLNKKVEIAGPTEFQWMEVDILDLYHRKTCNGDMLNLSTKSCVCVCVW